MPQAQKLERKESYKPISNHRRLDLVARFKDDIISKLTAAFLEVVRNEGWGKRDLANISGIDETTISRILRGRRKNLTAETIALLARAMKKRPELLLVDIRPKGNKFQVNISSEPTQLTAETTSHTAAGNINVRQMSNAAF
jgi:transcriptional regulator with XRE-family HTH domain